MHSAQKKYVLLSGKIAASELVIFAKLLSLIDCKKKLYHSKSTSTTSARERTCIAGDSSKRTRQITKIYVSIGLQLKKLVNVKYQPSGIENLQLKYPAMEEGTISANGTPVRL